MPLEPARGRAARIAGRALSLRCPRCGATPLFRQYEPTNDGAAAGTSAPRRAVTWFSSWFRMHPSCALCGLVFERAPGYWIGAIYVNYGVTTVIAIGGYFTLWRLASPSTAAQLAVWVPFVIVFPLWFFRYSRSLWLAVEYFVNPEP
ncbi:MAG: DUF983 domain-containing protein [Candidatus Rokubacteria bacterium]|nr:DUF983 domain-containing protein [Candidatus Rokubacteria bacterium]MBI3825176.1 DUF983 domain-containing protein [Candidatus Rokubacteria bacterium]